MDPELRARLGKVAYEAQARQDGLLEEWEELDDKVQELYRKMAEAVARELCAMMLPYVQGVIVGVQKLMGEEH